MDITELISIRLATGSEVGLDSICSVPIVFYDFSGHGLYYNLKYNLLDYEQLVL